MIHLRVDCYEGPHPVDLMRSLGITYQHSTPQSMGDQWWFWNCKNVPSHLPDRFSVLDLDPQEAVGFGLSQEIADKITANKSQQ